MKKQADFVIKVVLLASVGITFASLTEARIVLESSCNARCSKESEVNKKSRADVQVQTDKIRSVEQISSESYLIEQAFNDTACDGYSK